MPKVYLKFYTFDRKDHQMLIQFAFSCILIGDREGTIEELALRHEVVPGEPIEDISCLVSISILCYVFNCQFIIYLQNDWTQETSSSFIKSFVPFYIIHTVTELSPYSISSCGC